MTMPRHRLVAGRDGHLVERQDLGRRTSAMEQPSVLQHLAALVVDTEHWPLLSMILALGYLRPRHLPFEIGAKHQMMAERARGPGPSPW